jgi:acyl-CoA hydrolase
MAGDVQEVLARWVRPGSTVALADGVGSPAGLCADLSAVARAAGGVRLILGWCPELPATLDLSAFADVRAFMPGGGLRQAVAAGAVRYVPAYLSQLPALLAGVWRPDVLLLAVRETSRGLSLGSEVSWINVAARAAGVCIAELNNSLPQAVRRNALEDVELVVISESDRPPVNLPGKPFGPVFRQIGAELATLVEPGAAVQFGPGPIGEAFLAALEVPVRIDSGISTDSLVDLDARGLLIGDPVTTYLSGTAKLYDWADGRGILEGIEVTHDQSRLDSLDLVAVNTALQIDLLGQVGLDAPADGFVAGIGGHADYATAASRSANGISVIALPSRRRGQPTLAGRLAIPVSTPRSVVDVVVTEHGTADLRGLSDDEREKAIYALFRGP